MTKSPVGSSPSWRLPASLGSALGDSGGQGAPRHAEERGAMVLNDYARSNDPFTKIGRQQIAVDAA